MDVKYYDNRDSEEEFCRDFPPGCGISGLKFMGFSNNKKKDNYIRDWPSGCGPNASKSIKKLSENEKDCFFNGDSNTWRRNVSALKSKPQKGCENDEIVYKNPKKNMGKDPILRTFREGKTLPREDLDELRKTQKGKGKEIAVSGVREEVLEMLRVFRKRCNEISKSGRGIKRVDTAAYGELKDEGKIVSRSAMIIGHTPGVEIGDKFNYRIELVIVGLHKQFQSGIDTMTINGVTLTTCIVANEGHMDRMNDPNALVYIGQGGNLKKNETGVPPDQELKGGNRGLYNSMERKKPVRVVRGLSSEKSSNAKTLYVYDGLYEVKNCQQTKGRQGNMQFEFQLTRCADQAPVNWKECRKLLC